MYSEASFWDPSVEMWFSREKPQFSVMPQSSGFVWGSKRRSAEGGELGVCPELLFS